MLDGFSEEKTSQHESSLKLHSVYTFMQVSYIPAPEAVSYKDLPHKAWDIPQSLSRKRKFCVQDYANYDKQIYLSSVLVQSKLTLPVRFLHILTLT